jgi:hypothetical protein
MTATMAQQHAFRHVRCVHLLTNYHRYVTNITRSDVGVALERFCAVNHILGAAPPTHQMRGVLVQPRQHMPALATEAQPVLHPTLL